MTDREENPMVEWITKYDAALNDKPFLAGIYNEPWRQKTRPKLLNPGGICCLGNAFGYQAPLFEEGGLIRRGWQTKLEEGASVLAPVLSPSEWQHLAKRMRDTESTSAEEELLLARGFAREFGPQTIKLPQGNPDKPRPEFEVRANGCRILVEAKGHPIALAIEQERDLRRTVEDLLGIRMGPPPLLDEKVDRWIKNKVYTTLQSKCETDSGLILVLSLYTVPHNFLSLIDMVRTLAVCPGNLSCFRRNPGDLNMAEKYWPLAIALVSGGSIQGVWFNLAVRDRLHIDATTQERIRTAITDSFFPREDGVFFDETMSDEDYTAMIQKMRG